MNIPPYYSSKELTDACEFAAERARHFAKRAKEVGPRHHSQYALLAKRYEIARDVLDDAIADAQNREDAEIRQAQDEEQNPEGMTRFDPYVGSGAAR